jgi:hypothetical protein
VSLNKLQTNIPVLRVLKRHTGMLTYRLVASQDALYVTPHVQGHVCIERVSGTLFLTKTRINQKTRNPPRPPRDALALHREGPSFNNNGRLEEKAQQQRQLGEKNASQRKGSTPGLADRARARHNDFGACQLLASCTLRQAHKKHRCRHPLADSRK